RVRECGDRLWDVPRVELLLELEEEVLARALVRRLPGHAVEDSGGETRREEVIECPHLLHPPHPEEVGVIGARECTGSRRPRNRPASQGARRRAARAPTPRRT